MTRQSHPDASRACVLAGVVKRFLHDAVYGDMNDFRQVGFLHAGETFDVNLRYLVVKFLAKHIDGCADTELADDRG